MDKNDQVWRALAFVLVWFAMGHFPAWAQGPARVPMYLYTSPTTEHYLRSQGQSYEPMVKLWRAYFKRRGSTANEVTREQLIAGIESGVLILPSAVALDESERDAIARFAGRGGSLLGSGLFGTRDARGQFVGLDFLHSTFQIRTKGFFPATDDSFFMPFGDGPVTWPIPAGRRMPLVTEKDAVLRIASGNVAAVAMDWSRSQPTGPDAVMSFAESARSRVAYFSFADTAWRHTDDVILVLDATLGWLRREPQAYKSAWPDGHVAAHLMEMDTEDKFESAPNFAKDLESQGFKGTFYCLTSEAIRYPDIVRDLIARGHEIAYHADVHFGFKGASPGEQELRIRFMKQQMQGILGERSKEATGFRAPTESYDATTEMLLRKHGMLHHAADESASEDRLPFFSTSEYEVGHDKALVVLPRTQMDDVTFRKGLKYTIEQVRVILAHDLDLTVRSGAFGLLSVHTQHYVDGGLMHRTMGEYVQKVASYGDRLWVARGDEIASWWRQRDAVHVDQKWTGKTLQVSLQTTAAVRGFTVFVTLPEKNAPVHVATMPDGTAVRIKPIDAYRSALVFDTLPSGTTQASISFL